MTTQASAVHRRVAAPTGDEHLIRTIGPWALGANCVNSAVGAGIFVLPGLVAAILGPAAVVAYLICGLAVALVLTCFIEIGSFVTRSGGPVAYIEEAFGSLAGFLAWGLYSVGFEVVANAALADMLLDELALAVPALAHGPVRVAALFLLFGGLAAVNIAGVKHGVRLSVSVTVAKLLPLVFIIAAGVFLMHNRQLHWTGWPSAAKLGEASLILFFAFQGSEEALMPSAEIRDPSRTVPRAMFGAVGTLILLYVALQMVSQGILGSDLALQSTAPLAAVAAHIIGRAGRFLILTGVAISIFGSITVGTLAAPRAFFLAAQDGMLPECLARVHPRFRTPHVAILTVAWSPRSCSCSPYRADSRVWPWSPASQLCACTWQFAWARSGSATRGSGSGMRFARLGVPSLESSARQW